MPITGKNSDCCWIILLSALVYLGQHGCSDKKTPSDGEDETLDGEEETFLDECASSMLEELSTLGTTCEDKLEFLEAFVESPAGECTNDDECIAATHVHGENCDFSWVAREPSEDLFSFREECGTPALQDFLDYVDNHCLNITCLDHAYNEIEVKCLENRCNARVRTWQFCHEEDAYDDELEDSVMEEEIMDELFEDDVVDVFEDVDAETDAEIDIEA